MFTVPQGWLTDWVDSGDTEEFKMFQVLSLIILSYLSLKSATVDCHYV